MTKAPEREIECSGVILPSDIAACEHHLYITDFNRGAVMKYNLATGDFTPVQQYGEYLLKPCGLDLSPDGLTLAVCDTGHSRVVLLAIDGDGRQSPKVFDDGLNLCMAVAFSWSGSYVFVADTGNHAIVALNTKDLSLVWRQTFLEPVMGIAVGSEDYVFATIGSSAPFHVSVVSSQNGEVVCDSLIEESPELCLTMPDGSCCGLAADKHNGYIAVSSPTSVRTLPHSDYFQRLQTAGHSVQLLKQYR
jgi:hypothetical protein